MIEAIQEIYSVYLSATYYALGMWDGPLSASNTPVLCRLGDNMGTFRISEHQKSARLNLPIVEYLKESHIVHM